MSRGMPRLSKYLTVRKFLTSHPLHQLAQPLLPRMRVNLRGGDAFMPQSLCVRLLNPGKRLEAVTSKPLLLAGIAEKTRHVRKSRITITPMHGFGERARNKITQVSARLQEWGRSAEQFRTHAVWNFVCDYLVTLLTRFNWLIAEIEPPGKVPVNPN